MLFGLPGPASAQIAAAKDCISRPADRKLNGDWTNDCAHAIEIRGKISSLGSPSCSERYRPVFTTAPGGSAPVLGVLNPQTVCMEYADAATQYSSGYGPCPAIDSCGDGDVTIIDPPKLPVAAIDIDSDSDDISLDEGGMATLMVSLDFVDPRTSISRNIVIDLTSDNRDLTLSPATLTFTDADKSTGQDVTITAAIDDDDYIDDIATITATPRHTSGAYVAASTVTATVDDDDIPPGTIEVSPAGTLAITEGGSASLDISLGATPNTNVTVSLAKTNADVILSLASLTFTPSNHSIAQRVIVTTLHDNDNTDESDTITLVASGGIDAPPKEVSVLIDDDEPPSGNIQVSPSGGLSIDEGDATSIDVSLDTLPDSNVTVSLTKTNADVTLSPDSLTFTPSNHSIAQRIIVGAGQDSDNTEDSDTITLAASGGISASRVTISLAITDDDPPSGTIEVSPAGALAITEGGSASLDISLGAAPNAEVTIALSSTDPDISFDKSALTFIPSNYSSAQRVIVSASEDDDNNDDETDTITLTASGGIRAPQVMRSLSIDDNEPRSGTIDISPAGILMLEEGGSGSFEVSLGTAPESDVTIALSGANSDITLDKRSLTFTVSNYSTAQSVTVSAGEDDDDNNDDTDTITLTASGGIWAAQNRKAIAVDDNEPPSGTIRISPAGKLAIAEGGSASLDLRLGAAPIANVTIAVSSADSRIAFDKRSLTFTPSNYSSAQRITVSAREDDDAIDDSGKIVFTASGGIWAPQATISLSVADNDIPPKIPYDGSLVFLASEPLVIDEEGSETISLRLSRQPAEKLFISIATPSEDRELTITADSMSFTEENWNRYQSFDVLAHKDIDSADETFSIVFSFDDTSIDRKVLVRDNDREFSRTQALALPPPDSGDETTIRIQCKQDTPCSVAFDCSAQTNGEVFSGRLAEPIPARGAVSLSSTDIQSLSGGGSWSGKGRLGCALLSRSKIGSQVWTRSGAGVLVNNSALIRSVVEGKLYRADIESIPSPDSPDESNIRIRCNSQLGDCLYTSFACYSDEGDRYDWRTGDIAQGTTLHIQSETLATQIGYRWEGLGLGCEIRSRERFTVQVLTRTGGGGALVNNSATGETQRR